jgi:hypothetical protein
MKNKSKIYAVAVFIMLLLLFSSIAGARHETYSAAPSSDEGIYSFFSDVIRDAGVCLDNVVDESPDADTRASRLESGIKLAVEESRFYAVKGFESNVSRVVQPFSAPSGGVKKLTTYQLVFLTNYEILKNESDYSAYVEARTAIVNMRSGADAINCSLDGIALIELWNETTTLNFNVSYLSERLIDVYALIDHYEQLLEQYKVEAPAFEEDLPVVVVSDEHPLLYEEITIHEYANKTSTLSLFIDNTTHSLKNQTSEQRKKHRFENPGEHDIYAEGTTVDGKNIKSNIVKVDVSKIPTFIVLSYPYSALLNERIKITGLIVDYYDKPLHAVNVTVEAGEEETVTTDVSGRFVFYGTRSSEGYLKVSAFYPGNGTYKSSSANGSIFFSRFPISLQIAADKTNINVNETVKFMGLVSGISRNYTIPLSIFLNDRGEETITAENDFAFSLPFSQSGTYEVYVLFSGDSLFTDAKSNVVTIKVTEKPFFQKESFTKEIITNYRESNLLFYLLLLLVAIVSFFMGFYARALKKKIPFFSAKTNVHADSLFGRLHARTSHFKDKLLASLALLFTGIYARTFKWLISVLRAIRVAKRENKPVGTQEKEISETANAEVSGARPRNRIHVFRDKIIAPLLLILMNFYALILKRNGHSSKDKEAEQGNESAEKTGMAVANEEVGKRTNDEAHVVKKLEDFDLGEAYRLLFDATITQYDLGKSLTPRELSEAIKNENEPFTDIFMDVTAIHERVFYGCMRPEDGEEERYFKEIGDILRYFKGCVSESNR